MLCLFVFLGNACQNTAESLPTSVQTDLANLQAAKQSLADIRTSLDGLRSALNAVPASIQTDPSSKFSDLQQRVELLDARTAAMVSVYDQIVPELQQFQAKIARSADGKTDQAQYDQLYARFKGYEQGIESVQKEIKTLQTDISRLK